MSCLTPAIHMPMSSVKEPVLSSSMWIARADSRSRASMAGTGNQTQFAMLVSKPLTACQNKKLVANTLRQRLAVESIKERVDAAFQVIGETLLLGLRAKGQEV